MFNELRSIEDIEYWLSTLEIADWLEQKAQQCRREENIPLAEYFENTVRMIRDDEN